MALEVLVRHMARILAMMMTACDLMKLPLSSHVVQFESAWREECPEG